MIPEHRWRAWRAALDVCVAVRAAVNDVPLHARAKRVRSLLKPPPEVSAAPDAAGERAALRVLSLLAREAGVEVRVVVDPASGRCVRLAPIGAPRAEQGGGGAAAGPSGPSCASGIDPIDPGGHAAACAGDAYTDMARELIEEGAPGAASPSGGAAAGPADAATAAASGAQPSDPPTAAPAPGGAAPQLPRIYAYLDAVDGTLLLAGLSNDAAARPPIFRLAGAGTWAVGIALTDPTTTPLAGLRLGDFTVAVVADGAAGCCCGCGCGGGGGAGGCRGRGHGARLQPSVACAVWHDGDGGAGTDGVADEGCGGDGGGGGGADGCGRRGRYVTYDCSDGWPGADGTADDANTGRGAAALHPSPAASASAPPLQPPPPPLPPRLFTTSCLELGGTFAYLDAFQAHDAATAGPRDPAYARALFCRLSDRGAGGAFDVARAYGNLGALLRCFFGWRGGGGGSGGDDNAGSGSIGGGGELGGAWLEPQTGAFVVVNENLANLIPAVPLVLGAGGVATDLEGRGLAGRRLAEGRADVVYAGNAALHAAVMLIARGAAADAAAATAAGAAAGAGASGGAA